MTDGPALNSLVSRVAFAPSACLKSPRATPISAWLWVMFGKYPRRTVTPDAGPAVCPGAPPDEAVEQPANKATLMTAMMRGMTRLITATKRMRDPPVGYESDL